MGDEPASGLAPSTTEDARAAKLLVELLRDSWLPGARVTIVEHVDRTRVRFHRLTRVGVTTDRDEVLIHVEPVERARPTLARRRDPGGRRTRDRSNDYDVRPGGARREPGGPAPDA